MYPPLRALLSLSLLLATSAFATGELPPPEGEFTGVVTETMTSGGYIYLNVANDSGSVWVATGDCTAEVGDEVRVPASMEMRDFRSATLNRTFPSILFAARVYASDEDPVTAGQSALPEGHPALPVRPEEKARETPSNDPHRGTGGTAQFVAPGHITVAPGGLTIEDCFAGRETHAGQQVKVRGVVVKYNPGIMGANWIHLKDGTGGSGTNDLVLKTKETAQVGDIVVTEGTIEYDREIGAGYSFPAIIEDAAVKVEGKYVEAPADIRS
jgi:hypothetical protein